MTVKLLIIYITKVKPSTGPLDGPKLLSIMFFLSEKNSPNVMDMLLNKLFMPVLYH